MKNVRNYPNDRLVEGVLTIIFGRIMLFVGNGGLTVFSQMFGYPVL